MCSTCISRRSVYIFLSFVFFFEKEKTYNIQRIGDPKGDEIVPAPLASFGVD